MIENEATKHYFDKKKYINCRGKLIDLSQKRVMGILNITPDSFYDGGKHNSLEAAINQFNKMRNEGADMIDIGAYSSRPNAEHISEKEELKRLTPLLAELRKLDNEIILSVDTFRAEVAKTVVENFEVDIINDISGATMDKAMIETIAKLQVPYILMHIQGTPQNMQQNPHYKDVVGDVLKFFATQTEKLRYAGVNDIIVDPGFGFGKTIEHNYQLINRLQEFRIVEFPLLVGLSRKSMIYKPLQITPAEALVGTIALNTIALSKGADILRVHDVAEAKQLIQLSQILHNA